MIRILAVVFLVGCATQYQSARTLAPGKTQVTAGASRVDSDATQEAVWFGDLQVRTGLSDRADFGARLQRNASSGTFGAENISMLTIDPKFLLTNPLAKTQVSIGVPIGIVWAEDSQGGEDGGDGLEFDQAAIVFAPTLYASFEISPGTEVVVGPKIVVIKPDGDEADTETEFGFSIGVRIGDPSRSWAVHPELGILQVNIEDESEQFLTFGIGIVAGN